MISGRSHHGRDDGSIFATKLSVAAAAAVTGALVAIVATHRETATVLLLVAAAVVAALAWASSLVLLRRLSDARALALRDPLTGLPNRVLLDDRIERAVVHAERTGERFAVLEIDLDGFKDVNDVRGHEAGDQVLAATAARLEGIVRASDTVARVGGDEFVVVSTGTATEEEAGLLVHRIRQELRVPFVVAGGLVEIDASVGVAIYPTDGSTPMELLGRADSTMFQSKRGMRVPGDAPRRGSLDVGIVRELETALENGELVVHFQPVAELAGSTVVGAESLVRRVHPERGIVTPAEFLPHVERTSLIREITLHVLTETYREIARWQAAGHTLDAYVNVPLRLIGDPVLLEGIAGLSAAYHVDPRRVTLEVGGFAQGAAHDVDRDGLVELRRHGVRLALDDFGAGSSLTALRALPVDEVKLDASFVRGLGNGRADEAVATSLVNLAHELGLVVTAEGVESGSGWHALRALGCDRAQGYLLQRPLDADRFAAWLDRPLAALAS